MSFIEYTSTKRFVSVLFMILIFLVSLGFTPIIRSSVAQAAGDPFSYEDYASVLNAYVDTNGMVNYKALKTNRKQLDAFASSLAKLDLGSFEKWSDKRKIAFWINAYNALTLMAIVDHYPIKASLFKSVLYPKNSIRQISGVWTDLQFPVMSRKMTLDEIEHQVLRAKFNEPRIHVALVCAAMGCPILRNEPYTGDKLDAQLKDQSAGFVKDSQKFRIDRNTSTVYLSSIFKWFGEDFVKSYGTKDKFGDLDDTQKAVLNFVSRFLNPSDKAYLAKGGFSLEYLKYDWSLNEQGA